MLGSTLTDALTTPLWKWNDPKLVADAVSPEEKIIVRLVVQRREARVVDELVKVVATKAT